MLIVTSVVQLHSCTTTTPPPPKNKNNDNNNNIIRKQCKENKDIGQLG